MGWTTKREMCSRCDGDGYVYENTGSCRRCGGNGYKETLFGGYADCGRCNGSGKESERVTCSKCSGNGRLKYPVYVCGSCGNEDCTCPCDDCHRHPCECYQS